MRDRVVRFYFGVALCSLVALVALLTVAFAHDSAHPELNDWFMGLRSHSGMPCCDGSDALHIADPDWESHDGHYRVKLDGQWVDVPDQAVVDGPNKDGRALVWPYFIDGKPIGVRCFLPGAGA